MSVLEKIERYVDEPGRLSRRRFVGRVAKVSFGLAAASVGAGALAKPAYASYCCGLCSDCCGWPLCPDQTGNCPTGCSGYQWYCNGGGCTWVCGECCTSMCQGTGCASQCKCSYAYALCSPGCPCAPQVKTMMENTTLKDLLYTTPYRSKPCNH